MIPALYDRYLGPMLFEPYAADLAARIAALAPDAVLETAAGTGIVTTRLAEVLPDNALITATDLNQAIIDVAAAKTTSPKIEWHTCDATRLPFDDGSFDFRSMPIRRHVLPLQGRGLQGGSQGA